MDAATIWLKLLHIFFKVHFILEIYYVIFSKYGAQNKDAMGGLFVGDFSYLITLVVMSFLSTKMATFSHFRTQRGKENFLMEPSLSLLITYN